MPSEDSLCNVSQIYYYLDNIVLTNSTSINQISENINGILFQNLFSESTAYSFKYFEKNNYSFLIVDCNGRFIRSYEKIKNSEIEIERNGLAAGMYFYFLFNNNKIMDKGKLVVQ